MGKLLINFFSSALLGCVVVLAWGSTTHMMAVIITMLSAAIFLKNDL